MSGRRYSLPLAGLALGAKPVFKLESGAISYLGLDVRFGSKADIGATVRDVRFTPESGHSQRRPGCPLSAISRHTDKPDLGVNLRAELENHILLGISGAFGLTGDSENAILRLVAVKPSFASLHASPCGARCACSSADPSFECGFAFFTLSMRSSTNAIAARCGDAAIEIWS